jgi:hypothetical protein
MTKPVPHDTVRKVRKLAELAGELPRTPFAISVTRLTSLKSLCRQPSVANRFVTYLARKTLERVEQGKGRSAHPDTPEQHLHRQMMTEALAEMEAWERGPTEERRQRLLELLGKMRGEQNEYKRIPWGPVRQIHDWELLLFEYALHCLLHRPDQAGYWAYQTARHYAERYDASHGTGLTPASAPLVQDIADFWTTFFNLDLSAGPPPAGRSRKAGKPSAGSPSARTGSGKKGAPAYTPRQGQFLAFIHLYRKLHRQGPAELDLAKFFRVTAPSAHLMIVALEERGLITREPGVARSVRVAIPEEEVPALEDVPGPPW